MTQTSAKRRAIAIASIVIILLVVSSIIALIEYNPLAAARINLSLSFNQANVMQGGSSQVKVEVTSIGKAENVTLSSNIGLSGINCTFEPNSGESNFTSTLTVSVPDSAPAGNYSVTVIASSGGKAVNASMILSVLHGDITVSGEASSAALCEPFFTSLTGIHFTDIQTRTATSFNFPSTSPRSVNPFGEYSVILMNEHTYNVTISYYCGPSYVNMNSQVTDFVGNFTVNAPVGETAISQDFG